ncbi:tetratricopeptide repeat protein [Devosia rhizoryzae]|uniref:Sel1 repeat family protein n=1 Tax=Devosia rhizoryzae TaxID=2774137 RepID=A0ABX7C860_9HYPH|nr:tetratricopeptide repeat protein [Devosia rhizoryzae]QQR40396.1 sel1 repeat family protein [Devosia rhizoryzae]
MRFWSTLFILSALAGAAPMAAEGRQAECAPQDRACVKAQLELAAAGGDLAAKIELARLLLDELEQGLNWARAATLLEQVSATGDAWSTSILAGLYLEGKGVPQDGRKVMALLIPQAAKGNVGAVAGLGDLFAKGAGMIAPDLPRAARYFARAAEAGDRHGAYQLALMLLNGEGIAADVPRSVAMFEDLNTPVDPWISIQLGEIYAGGKASPAERAIEYFSQAAETGNAPAMVRLAQMYQSGVGSVQPDASRAMALLEQAASLGDMGGRVNLALMLLADGKARDIDRAVSILEEAAAEDAVWPATILAGLYAQGKVVPLDGVRAKALLQPYADQGVAAALVGLGDIYAKGAGQVAADLPLARRLFTQAADTGDLSAKNRLGFMLLAGEGGRADAKRGLDLLEPVMESGDTWAMLQLADIYAQGIAVPQDANKAIDLYGRAAELGNAAGLSRIGLMFRNGAGGVAANTPLALDYFEQALAADDATGRIQVALMLLEEGSSQDIGRAVDLLDGAAKAGDVWATTILADLLIRGEKVAADGTRALALLQPLAEDENAAALASLGNLYAVGAGEIEADIAKAAGYYEQAAALGEYSAKSRLGMMLVKGEGIQADPVRGLSLLRDVAAIGDGWAKIQLGDVLASGENVPLDAEGAIAAYQAAREAGLPAAAIKLGYLYLSGKGSVSADPVRAASYFSDAADAGEDVGKISLALLMLEGKGVEKDTEQAITLLQEVAARGSGWANGTLGGLFADGRNLTPDFEQARAYSEAALQGGDKGAMLRFGMMLATGPLAPKHRSEGIELVQEAASAQLPGAMVERARLQSMGLMGSDGAKVAEASLLGEIDAGDPAALRLLLQVYRSGGPGLKASVRRAQSLLDAHADLLTTEAVAFETLALRAATPATQESLGQIGSALRGVAPTDLSRAVQMLFWGDKNAYVYALQYGLRDAGLYDGPLSGYLTRQTISAINQVCAQQHIEQICRKGPLTPEVAVELSKYLAQRPVSQAARS